PLLDSGSLPLRSPESLEAAARLRSLGASLGAFRCVHSPRFPQEFVQFAARQELQEQLQQLQFQLSDQALELLPEYHQRLQVGPPKQTPRGTPKYT
ncbi:SKIV2 Helicase, partial [Piaya cayana]|nr:SKIV2 Helicase [Piaya cayana]